MRILWFTNVELNCIAEQLGRTIVVGGWMNTMAIQLSENVETELFVAFGSCAQHMENMEENR